MAGDGQRMVTPGKARPVTGAVPVVEEVPMTLGAGHASEILPDGSCDVLAANGCILTRAEGRLTRDQTALILRHVARNGALLLYYFCQGGREVEIRAGNIGSSGWLHTQWGREGRHWEVRFACPVQRPSDRPRAGASSAASAERRNQ